MLTKITAYSQWPGVDPIIFNVINRPEDDKFEVRDIQGLGAVKANVNTTPFGSVDGEQYTGSSVGKRNIVLTLGLTPDWQDWTMSRLRRLLDLTFLPKQLVRLVFETMEFSPVEISGYVESNDPNMFSKDPEQQISIICPDLYFKSVDPVVINSSTDAEPVHVDYNGNVETGINVRVGIGGSGAAASLVTITSEDKNFVVDAPIDSGHYMMMQSIPGKKFVNSYTTPGGVITSRLKYVHAGYTWLNLFPGLQDFSVLVNAGIYPWQLTYYELFGSL